MDDSSSGMSTDDEVLCFCVFLVVLGGGRRCNPSAGEVDDPERTPPVGWGFESVLFFSGCAMEIDISLSHLARLQVTRSSGCFGEEHAPMHLRAGYDASETEQLFSVF